MGTTPDLFTSVELDRDLRAQLLLRLAALHAEQPLAPDDPRAVVARVADQIGELGLEAVRIRGTVSVSGAEVDHVWLAVAGQQPWVLDASFPLLEPAFAGLLAGYVAGTTSSAELVALASTVGVDRRVVGLIPPRAAYRGQPYWTARRN